MRTRPDGNSVAACSVRATLRLAMARTLRAAGSTISARAIGAPAASTPPTTSSRPDGRRVTVCCERGVASCMPGVKNAAVAGSKISTSATGPLASTPPIT